MPFTDVSDALERHPNLAKYSEKAQRGFVESFNSCNDDGGDDSKCFAIAYSVANKVDAKKEGAATLKRWDTRFLSPEEAKSLGNRKFDYVPYKELTLADQGKVRQVFPNKFVGGKYNFADEHFYYPVDVNGGLAKANRVIAIPMWIIQDDEIMTDLGYAVNPTWKYARGGTSQRDVSHIAFNIAFGDKDRLTPDEVGIVCPRCAKSMRSGNICWIKTSAVHDKLFAKEE